MFDSLGAAVAHRPRATVLIWLVVSALAAAVAVVGVTGEGLFDRLSVGEPRVPGSSSDRAAEILADQSGGVRVTLLVQDVDVATDAAALGEALGPVRVEVGSIDGVADVIDPWVLPSGPTDPAVAALVSARGDGFLMSVDLDPTLDGDAQAEATDAVVDRLRDVPQELRAAAPEASGIVSTGALIGDEIVEAMERDLVRGEIIALPIALLVMVVVFGGVLAAGMPLLGALASIAGGLGALLGFSYVLDLDSVVVNVVTVLGLGLSIDYGLLMVSRFREELHAGIDEEPASTHPGGRGRTRHRAGARDAVVVAAVRRTVATAGRTVTFSAVTIAVAVAGLLLMRADVLRSIGAAAVSVVVIALLTALTLVPALLTLGGRRLVGTPALARVPGLRWLGGRLGDVAPSRGIFSRLAGRVQRRPWLVGALVLLVLGVMAYPLTHLALRSSTTDLLPADSDQRAFLAAIAEDYPQTSVAPIRVVAEAQPEDLAPLVAEIEDLDGVASVDGPVPLSEGSAYAVIGVRPDAEDPAGEDAVGIVRDLHDLDEGPEFWVGGQAANQVDFADALREGLPLAGGLVVLATFVLLFLMTGSVLVPLKALLVNILSLAASLGAATWIFADGHGAGLLGFTSNGGLEGYIVAVVVAFGFGLAMDYEVFLLARVKELYDAGLSNDAAVRLGLQRSGRIITSAALVIIVVFAGFAAGEMLMIKEVGVALALTVAVDATLVRMLLVPATMTILGDANWWAPRPLRRVYERLSLSH
ncbi:integral membrane protein [Beutenbergia cavernae DSM 12333]|uniref:Integral membrane protein n=1 Tax=Beutenbergia cavernae (strain ATCC BAA-8 / DSM 12333 / CCUG 43141 / JCM 11478 / NBRC 16432 / NCIMB 13614 / HKI 0122) TaxID=471853 RepID=C5C5S3_BEUC1|nr:MMPL family transporter [Beutenbergia cavernae]ACQ80264.1 integral membrane protein [Beutenbergia cavernae DSM 12333]